MLPIDAAAVGYAALVVSAPGIGLWSDALRRQIYLGDEDSVDRMQALVDPGRAVSREVPKQQRCPARTLTQWLATSESRESALLRVHTEGGMTMSAIARELKLSVSRVSRLIGRAELGAAAASDPTVRTT